MPEDSHGANTLLPPWPYREILTTTAESEIDVQANGTELPHRENSECFEYDYY
jgi:hypothetical protein